MTDQPPPIIASFDNAYRIAVRLADTTNIDQRVVATGDPQRPFAVSRSGRAEQSCVAFVTVGA